jgi:hypothetical protein
MVRGAGWRELYPRLRWREKNVLDNPFYRSDGMRRAGPRRDAIRSQVIDALEAQKIKETGNEED